MFKSSSIRWAGLLGVSLLAGCGTPPLSVSNACAPGMGQENGQQQVGDQQASGAMQRPGAMAALNQVDRQFVMDVGRGNNAEIALSQLALQRATGQSVRQFAQRMVTDHTQAGQALQQAASQAGLSVPQDLKPEDQALARQLSSLSGEAFDQAYMTKMLQDHVTTVALFETEIRQGRHPAITGFARDNLPTIQDHLRQAREIVGTRAAPTS